MCERCQQQAREMHQAAVTQAMEHLDGLGVPEDSLMRGLTDVSLAAQQDPLILGKLLKEMWPSADCLMQ